jgi:hypothetical protein
MRSKLHSLIPAGLCLAAFALASPAAAQHPLGPPVLVNVPSADIVELSSMAMNAGGDFVVTWVGSSTHTGEPRQLLARRFAADGTPTTDEIAVVDDPVPGADNSKVAIRDDGSFIVVFGVFPDLVVRTYGADGSFGIERVLVLLASGHGFRLAPMPGGGGFALSWARDSFSFVRHFDATGLPYGPERRVGPVGPPALAAQPGGFVATWIANRPEANPRYGDPYLVAQRFGADGERQGGRSLLQSPLTSGSIDTNAVASDAAGNFLTLWQGTVGSGPLADGIYARRFKADGTPTTARLRLEGNTALSPQLAMDRAGNFVVAWLQLAAGPNGQTGAFAQRFTAEGAPFRPAFRADTGGSGEPLVASAAGGNFVVIWTQPRKIFAQRYRKR